MVCRSRICRRNGANTKRMHDVVKEQTKWLHAQFWLTMTKNSNTLTEFTTVRMLNVKDKVVFADPQCAPGMVKEEHVVCLVKYAFVFMPFINMPGKTGWYSPDVSSWFLRMYNYCLPALFLN